MNSKVFEIIDFMRGDDIVICFFDLCNFTKMVDNAVNKQTEKKVIGILNQFYERSSKIIYENNGIIDKFLGDGIMALFGSLFNKDFEKKAEDYLMDAVRCGLEIESYIQTLSCNIGVKLNISTGIWMGNVFVGFSTAGDRTKDISVIGDPVNIAARLLKLAGENEMIIPFIPEVEFKNKLDNLIKPYGMVKYYEKVKIKGKEKELNVFRIIDEDLYWEKFGH